MSNDEQKAAIGEMALMYGEAKKTLAAARGKAVSVAATLKALAEALETQPQNIAIEGENIYVPSGFQREKKPASHVNLDMIADIIRTAAKADETIQNLGSNIRDLGIEDSGYTRRR